MEGSRAKSLINEVRRMEVVSCRAIIIMQTLSNISSSESAAESPFRLLLSKQVMRSLLRLKRVKGKFTGTDNIPSIIWLKRVFNESLVAPFPIPNIREQMILNVSVFISGMTYVEQHLQGSQRSWRGQEPEFPLYYSLSDLWDSFGEWSVYGVGVPLVLNGKESVVQYYVPFLSDLQLYVDPVNPPSRRLGDETNVESSRETNSVSAGQQVLNSLRRSGLPMREKPLVGSSSDQAVAGRSPGTLVFEYLEDELPYNRKPLADKISALASVFPELRNYRSCDLLPSSWLSVAWYPIYRIPVGPTLKDLDASFLTFHSLSTNSIRNVQPRCHGVGGRNMVGGFDGVKVPLPVFGLAAYKLRGSILSPFGPLECQQENSLLQAAGSWLQNLQVYHHDYQFFLSSLEMMDGWMGI